MIIKKSKDFWNWFNININSVVFSNLSETEFEKLLDQLFIQLQSYSEGLYFQIEPNEFEFIVTAEGDSKYFIDVQTLIEDAPKLGNWKFIAFKPPKDEDFVTEHEDIILDPKQMWFLPLENVKNPKLSGFKIYIPKLDKGALDKYLFATWEVLDTLLGEISCAQDVNHLEIEELPNDPIELGLIELKDIRNYIIWQKKK